MPREPEYANMLNTRGGFYGTESDVGKFFEGSTRDMLKAFIRSFVECEVSIELVRQRICNKLGIKPDTAFNALDKDTKGYIQMEDIRNFLKSINMYPSEKNLQLLYQRWDKNEDGVISYEEFISAIQPFLFSGNANQ